MKDSNNFSVAANSEKEKPKEKPKAPSRPQDKLLNEIEEKEKALQKEKEEKEAREKEEAEKAKKAAEDARKAEEEAQKKIMEEARMKAEEMAKKLAKKAETPEECAKEDEIQRKIRDSVVIINRSEELAMLVKDPSKDIEMPDELRKLLKTLVTDSCCKLCSLRMIGPTMAPMHYNGKNHLKKVRTFVQTNGRSAGFNMETQEDSEGATNAEVKGVENVPEKEEEEVCSLLF